MAKYTAKLVLSLPPSVASLQPWPHRPPYRLYRMVQGRWVIFHRVAPGIPSRICQNTRHRRAWYTHRHESTSTCWGMISGYSSCQHDLGRRESINPGSPIHVHWAGSPIVALMAEVRLPSRFPPEGPRGRTHNPTHHSLLLLRFSPSCPSACLRVFLRAARYALPGAAFWRDYSLPTPYCQTSILILQVRSITVLNNTYLHKLMGVRFLRESVQPQRVRGSTSPALPGVLLTYPVHILRV
ncbi:hypothetical protein BJ166DRAFT_528300 [Pestalotiopsis sp. NC0098]|nr:hypothetical protein BJ166DRAFT_528300 [Pestalotiopsis sp. NC0098]